MSLWRELAAQAREAGRLLPELPTFAEVVAGDRERAFRELGYAFWNRELLDGLAARCRAERLERWVEVAAGTGRWAAELARRGLAVAATDNHEQSKAVGGRRAVLYGEWVAPLAARDAVRQLRPEGILCAWPPLGSGLVPALLDGGFAGSEGLRLVICIGEPGGATDAPVPPDPLPAGWQLESWPECEAFLAGFNDPPAGDGWRSCSRLLVYQRVEGA